MKKLIKEKKRKFQTRKNRDYVAELAELGISEEEAWEQILYLNFGDLINDWKPSYSRIGESLVFKKKVNGVMTYIKLKIEIDDNVEKTVCMSFHKDERFF